MQSAFLSAKTVEELEVHDVIQQLKIILKTNSAVHSWRLTHVIFQYKNEQCYLCGFEAFLFSYAMEVNISWLTYIMLRLNEDICLRKLAADPRASAKIYCRDSIHHVRFKFKFLRWPSWCKKLNYKGVGFHV